jgi:antirestriction protein ArdC
METSNNGKWLELLKKAVKEPGTLSAAYHAFYAYSAGNQSLAYWQCVERGIEPGPIATYPGWLKLGRHVRRGEKAITLCMPVSFTKKVQNDDGDEEEVHVSTFIYKPHWFVLCQTEGDDYTPAPIPDWDKRVALSVLDITETRFTKTDGNCMGYARGREVAISPLAFDYWKTFFHECAHILLGHTDNAPDSENIPPSLAEVEAEAVALIVGESLGLGSQAECRGYIQHWLQGRNAIPERSAQRIFNVADKILKAGYAQEKGGATLRAA